MKILNTKIKDLKVIEQNKFVDNRGFLKITFQPTNTCKNINRHTPMHHKCDCCILWATSNIYSINNNNNNSYRVKLSLLL